MMCVDYGAGVDTACTSHLPIVSIHFHSKLHPGRLAITFVILASTNRSRTNGRLLHAMRRGSLVVQVTYFVLDIYVFLTFRRTLLACVREPGSGCERWDRGSCLTKDQPSSRTSQRINGAHIACNTVHIFLSLPDVSPYSFLYGILRELNLYSW
jgi:hypothetical protein